MALIENNKIKAGEKLPSEFDLQNKYQASRDTIRKALLLLSQNGYIQKSQGKSSIVLDINRFNFPVSGLTSFKEIASDIKGKVETIVHTCECIEPDEEIKKLLMLKSGTKVWYIERVRKNIVRFWMEKGVKGFRFDVINLISKAGFEDDFSVDGDGRSFYTDGPRIHEFLQELARDSFAKDKDIITVGEMSSTTMENCYKYAGEKTGELSMVFTFHHLKVDFMGNEKWVLVPTDFMKLKQLIFDWQINMEKNNAWNAVFWCNHDQPRVISRFGSDDKYHKESGKMLATLIHCLRGTPYIYQGEEIGMTNPHFKSIEQYRNVESLNHYQILQDKGMTKEQDLMILDVHSRDNSRTPMQWDDSINAGFTTGTPWIQTADNYTEINVKNSLEDKDSILYYYQKLIQLRKNYDVIAYGDIKPLLCEDKRVFAYGRNYKGQKLIVICNFYPTTYEIELPYDLLNYKCILNNYKNEAKAKKIALKPYETLVYCNL